ncbi:MAG: hypothetical protein AB8I69_11170, partial [Anaerolineae bacterium]
MAFAVQLSPSIETGNDAFFIADDLRFCNNSRNPHKSLYHQKRAMTTILQQHFPSFGKDIRTAPRNAGTPYPPARPRHRTR